MFSQIFAPKKPGTLVATQPREKVTTEVQDDLKLIQAIAAGLEYDGFNVAKVREKAKATMSYGTLLILLVAYIKTGNSLTKKVQSGRLVDKGMAANVLDLMKKCGVTQTSKTADGLTLPRLAIAFAALVVAIRNQLKLPARVESSTPVGLQDLCLNGYINLGKISAAQDFVEKFSWVLAQATNKANASKKGWVDITPEASKKKLEEFRTLSKLAQGTDPAGIKVLTDFNPESPPAVVAHMYGLDVKKTAIEVDESQVTVEEKPVTEEEEKAPEATPAVTLSE